MGGEAHSVGHYWVEEAELWAVTFGEIELMGEKGALQI
jgi:hypothetical protein